MNKKAIVISALIFAITVVLLVCFSNRNIYGNKINITLTYESIATEKDFDKDQNVFYPTEEIKLTRDNYNLIKVICKIDNKCPKNITAIEFVPNKNEYVFYEAEYIDVRPTFVICPDNSYSFEAYIYVDKSLDTQEKIENVFNDTEFKFSVCAFNDIPFEGIDVQVSGSYLPKE